MSVAPAVLAVLPALIFFTLGTAKVVAVQPMRARAAEVGFSTARRDNPGPTPATSSRACLATPCRARRGQ